MQCCGGSVAALAGIHTHSYAELVLVCVCVCVCVQVRDLLSIKAALTNLTLGGPWKGSLGLLRVPSVSPLDLLLMWRQAFLCWFALSCGSLCEVCLSAVCALWPSLSCLCLLSDMWSWPDNDCKMTILQPSLLVSVSTQEHALWLLGICSS